ncbi:hypothetical protein C8F01DRAFT_1229163 [Mycena amicta]|nr:hypothetical protein C8F01DRAFT_1229163 [Mycena amicta]
MQQQFDSFADARHLLPISTSLRLSHSSLSPLHMPGPSTMRRSRSARIRSDVVAAARLTLNAVQASTDVFPPVKSAVSAVIVLLEMSERIKSNRKGCERIAQRSAQLVQDLWRQIKDFDVELPAEVKTSVVEIENLFRQIQFFFDELRGENMWQRLARQERNNSQIAEYGKLLDEAISDLSMNLELAVLRLHMESAAANEKRHIESAAVNEKRHGVVLAVSQMSETERLQRLTRIEVFGRRKDRSNATGTGTLHWTRRCESFGFRHMGQAYVAKKHRQLKYMVRTRKSPELGRNFPSPIDSLAPMEPFCGNVPFRYSELRRMKSNRYAGIGAGAGQRHGHVQFEHYQLYDETAPTSDDGDL